MLQILLFSLFFSLSSWAKPPIIEWDLLKELKIDDKKKATTGPKLQKIIGKEVTIKGFMMPLDFASKKVDKFLLMPYIPACMHVPPPPPNQIIYVEMKKGKKIAPSFYPVELEGKILLEHKKNYDTSYKIVGESLKEIKQ